MWRFVISIFLVIFFSTLVHAATNTPVASEEIKRAYADAIKSHLTNNWKYIATAENFNDAVVVKLRISRDGKISEKTIVQNAKHELLETEALRQLTAMEPFPQMPQEILKEVEIVQFKHQFRPTDLEVELESAEKFLKALAPKP